MATYSRAELTQAVRGERVVLIRERIDLTKRLGAINARLMELDKAEHLLEEP